MDSPASIRIAIATDLHYLQDKGGDISPQVCVEGSKVDPMAELLKMIASSSCPINPSADLLLCPGDITTRACVESFNKGWADLKSLRDALGATHLIAATGNHEISSRTGENHSLPGNAEIAIKPFEHLITATDYPAFFPEKYQKWVYWGRGFEVVCSGEWVVVIVNSCHYHNSLLPNEYERGRIGEAALSELELKLKELSGEFKYRVVMLHHPPIPHEELDVELGRIAMYNGDLLVKVIERTCEDWIVVHGHKHLSRLTKAAGAEYSPIVIGAASFGAMISGDLAAKTRNQFYILELFFCEDSERLSGRVESICWDSQQWLLTKKISHGLPHGCGFDLESPFKSKKIAQAIKDFIQNGSHPFVTWSELQVGVRELSYLMPQDISNLYEKLEGLDVKKVLDSGSWFPDQLWIENR